MVLECCREAFGQATATVMVIAKLLCEPTRTIRSIAEFLYHGLNLVKGNAPQGLADLTPRS